jgi:ABC-type glycerol-3-phosphate transport system permease component
MSETPVVHRASSRWDPPAVLTWVVVLVVFTLPICWILLKALQPESLVFSSAVSITEFTLANFRRAITQGSLASYTISTSIIALLTCAIVLPLGLVSGYALARFTFLGRATLLFLFMFSLTIPGLVNLLAVYQVFSMARLINNPLSLVLLYSASSLPLSVWLMRAYILSLPSEVEEAALIDGCSRIEILWRIVLPLALPGIGAVAILTVVSVFHEFIMAQTLVKVTGLGVVNQGLWRLQTEYTLDYTGIAAASILVSAVPVLLFVVLQRQFISGMTAGAMKG